MSIPLLMCRVRYDNRKQSERVRVFCYQIEAAIYFSEKSGLKSNYRLGEHEFRPSGNSVMEADLEHPRPRLRFADTNGICLSDVALSFSHIYSFPVYYHLTIDDVTFTHRMTSLDHYLFTPMSLTSQSFAFTREHHKRLGSGKHFFVLVLTNNAWTIVLFDELQLIEPNSELETEIGSFVAIYPHTCHIEVTTSAGTSVSSTNNKSVAKFNSVYSNRCPLWHVTTSLLKSITPYLVKAIAWSRASPEVDAGSTTTATPFVYDKLISSKCGFVVGRGDQMLLIRGNRKKYKLSVDVNSYKRNDQSSVITKSMQTFFPMISFTMDPRNYTMDSMPIKYEKIGKKLAAAIIIKNHLLSLNINKIVLAQYENNCDVAMRIRDGNIRNWLKTAIYIKHYFRLTDESFCQCSAVPIRFYKTQIFQVKSKDQTSVFKNQLNYKLDVTEPIIYADVPLFPPGLYVGKSFPTVQGQRHWQSLAYQQNSTLSPLDITASDVTIDDGTQRKVGETRYLKKTDTTLMLACAGRTARCVRTFRSDGFSKAERKNVQLVSMIKHFKRRKQLVFVVPGV